MKKLFLVLLIAAQGLLAIAQDNDHKEPYLVKPLSNESVKEVKVQTSGGSISVTAVAASEARVEVYVRGNNNNEKLSKEEIKQRLDEKYELTVSVTNNKLTAIARNKESIKDWKRSLSISFKVFVPKNISTDLTTSGGSINLDGIAGTQDFTTSGGSLNIENVSGNVKGRTSGGSIYVKNSTDDIDLSTSGGSIYAKNCKGNLHLTTSGGSVDLKALEGTINATTSGGSINGTNIKGELITATSGGSIRLDDIAASLNASTSGGNIDVAVTTLGKYIKIGTSAGNIDLELPKGKGLDLNLSASKIKTTTFGDFSGHTETGKIKGKLNGGGVQVDASCGGGNLSLAFK